ncbi:hypothetical protein [Rummeliibacillus pycnus]|uniref:hypothetical protein n=1 Tax=Rummeliibacillus pycnus TaxID=101070 RepID=UPI000C9A0FA5|nr:hypothetical protein [Rummeliibacillus pycnus]
MKKLFITIFSFLLFLHINVNFVNAASNDFEKYYYDIGYKDISNALIESNELFKTNVALPSQLPALRFTHAFGKLNDLDGEENDELEFEFINEKSPNNHYKINIRPVAYKVIFEEKDIDQKVKLNDGSEAIFSKTFTDYNTLAFEKNGLQYILSVDQKSDKKISMKNLIAIANSVR